MQHVLLFTVEFLSPITLGTIRRCHAFGKAIRTVIEKPLHTEMGFDVGELSSGLDAENPKYPNHWIMDIWCYNLVISKSDMEKALSKLKWMHVTSCRRQVKGIPPDIPKEKATSRLSDRTPEKRLAHSKAQKQHIKHLKDLYGKDGRYS